MHEDKLLRDMHSAEPEICQAVYILAKGFQQDDKERSALRRTS